MMRSERPDTYEVNSDGGDVALRVGIVGKTEEQARLSNTRVSDEEQLEEIITQCHHDKGASPEPDEL
ncbi:autophagy protein Apg9 [Aspergillus luchuensis]|uniref:Autophagy protein Apg9 n=1 Tax=Aspergillus kawachii TaxID=1069201 RepID=A0A146FRR5_ASPKA|nr:autophagy protein Apg9 [Aspergillus luchuensis]